MKDGFFLHAESDNNRILSGIAVHAPFFSSYRFCHLTSVAHFLTFVEKNERIRGEDGMRICGDLERLKWKVHVSENE